MRVWSAIFNIIGVLVLVMFGAYYFNVSMLLDKEFEQLRYEYAVRQATEAMFSSTLEAEDIELDYVHLDYVSIDSSEAIEIFDRVMCFNYDMSPSKENFASINESIAACVIAGYDGYYVTQMSEDDEIEGNGIAKDGYALRFSTKIPYYLTTNNAMYAIDTYKKTYMGMSSTSNTSHPTLYNEGKNLPAGVTEEDVTLAINTQIRGRILQEVKNAPNTTKADLSQFRLYFPEDTTVSGVNPFGVPGIFVVMSGARYASTESLSAMAVSGYKVIKKTNVIAFTDLSTNRSYYCYETQLRDEEKTAESGGMSLGGTYGNFQIENYYNSIQEAAEATSKITGQHFAPYYDIMVRKITKS